MEEGDLDIVGTAHISENSAEEVRETIEEKDPDVVCVELDDSRYDKLVNGYDSMDDSEVEDIILGEQSKMFFLNIILKYFQSSLGRKVGTEPGVDMKAAINKSNEDDTELKLIDRDISITLNRILGGIGLREKLWFLKVFLIATLLIVISLPLKAYTKVKNKILGTENTNSSEENHFSEDNLEKMTEDADEIREELKRDIGFIFDPLIDERDKYMAREIQEEIEKGKDVVAVVGAAHEKGIWNYLSMDEIPEAPVEKYESRISTMKLIGYAIPAMIIGMFFLLYMGGVNNLTLVSLAIIFFLINGIPAFFLALLTGAKLRNSIIGGCIAWFTTINPMLAPGFVVGWLELKYHNIKTEHLSEIMSIVEEPPHESFIANFKELNSIGTFKLLMIIGSTNIGSVIGTLAFVFVVIPYYGINIDFASTMIEGIANTVSILF